MHAWMAILLKNQGNEPIPTQYRHMGKIFLLYAHIETVNKLNMSITPPDLPPGKFRRGLRSAAGLID